MKAVDKITNVIQVDPNGKYVIIVDESASEREMDEIRDVLDDWWKDKDAPFLLVGSALIRLERVGEYEPRDLP